MLSSGEDYKIKKQMKNEIATDLDSVRAATRLHHGGSSRISCVHIPAAPAPVGEVMLHKANWPGAISQEVS
jgi:hypothetical protein